MRLHRLLSLVFLVATFAIAPWPPAAAQQTKDTPGCSCGSSSNKKADDSKSTGKHRRHHRRGSKKPGTGNGSAPRIIYVPTAPKAEPKVVATSAAFKDMQVNAGSEGREEGTIELSDQSAADDYSSYVNTNASPNLQAWIEGKTLHVYSPNGGNGHVVISNKEGRTLKSITISADPIPATATEKSIEQMASNSNGLWWFGLIAAIFLPMIFVLLLIWMLLQRGWFAGLTAAVNDGFEAANENLDNVYLAVDNTDRNLVHYAEQRTPGLRLARRTEVAYYDADEDRPRTGF